MVCYSKPTQPTQSTLFIPARQTSDVYPVKDLKLSSIAHDDIVDVDNFQSVQPGGENPSEGEVNVVELLKNDTTMRFTCNNREYKCVFRTSGDLNINQFMVSDIIVSMIEAQYPGIAVVGASA